MNFENLIPDSYLNFIASLTLLISILCLVLSFFFKQKSHSTKIFALTLVGALALFSSHWSTYFAAIFIVATAVTELEFLQNLAAIIRKDESYFKYKKESISKEENLKKKAEDVIAEDFTVDSEYEGSEQSTIDITSWRELPYSARMKTHFDIEEKALSKLSEKYGQIENGIRFRSHGISVEFDGIISSRNKNEVSKLFDVKMITSTASAYPMIRQSLNRFNDLINRYKSITRLTGEAHLVIVLNLKSELNEDKLNKVMEMAKDKGVTIEFIEFNEIGYNIK